MHEVFPNRHWFQLRLYMIVTYGMIYEEFRQGPLVAVEFATHAINFRTKSRPDRTFNYNFRLHCTYLVDGD